MNFPLKNSKASYFVLAGLSMGTGLIQVQDKHKSGQREPKVTRAKLAVLATSYSSINRASAVNNYHYCILRLRIQKP